MQLKLYNTLVRKKESLKSIEKGKIGLYTCGITAYWYPHIGNLRTYIFNDILKRVLEYNDYKVQHVMNITDVGHLTSDADTGEDKLEKGAAREKKTVWQIAELYTKHFQKDLKNLNIIDPSVWIKATDTIKEQIDLIKKLEKRGFTYVLGDGVYFDTSKVKNYGKLWGNKKPIELKAGARVKMTEGKKNITDFALWKFTPKGTTRAMEWKSPWGIGFPGWHTECVVMGMKELGIPFDIHTGGIDHIQIHHTNEIAQTEAAYDKPLAQTWMHGEFLIEKGGKMSKSKGDILILDTLVEKGFNPLSYRYLTLTAHYRSKLTFSWESLQAAQNALEKLYQKIIELKTENNSGTSSIDYKQKFLELVNDDLDMPKAVALMWKLIDDKQVSNKEKYNLLLNFDKIFGLGLDKIKKEKVPKNILELTKQREQYRENKEWEKADKIRKELKEMGYEIEDTQNGQKIIKL